MGDSPLEQFDRQIESAATADEVWKALHRLAASKVGIKLFTVMTLDPGAGLARRAYTSDPVAYPVAGAKPITRDRWFEIVHDEKRCFVANTLAEIATVFPDSEKIGSLGLGSVINLPVFVHGELAATINMLDVEHYYTPDRVHTVIGELTGPATRAYAAAFDLGGKNPD
jgi:hypothetical protein